MPKHHAPTKKLLIAMVVAFYLLAFYEFIQNTQTLSVKILMGAMGFVLLIGLVGFLRKRR